jgi:uncharacterized protein
VRLVRPNDAAAFLELAGEFLVEREAEHNLLLGISGGLVHSPTLHGDDAPYFAVVESAGRIVAAVLRTPPWNLVLSEIDDPDALTLVAANALESFGALPGVLGPKRASAAFADIWCGLTGAMGRIEVAERIYRADVALPPDGVAGRARSYEPANRETVVAWTTAFQDEALPPGSPRADDDWIERRLTQPGAGISFWVDDEPVSLCGFGGLTPNGVRIGPVYTPPEFRRHGYASALVAAITADQLRGGRRFCFLFTDLANPTSNSIYQQVGYEPVSDVDQWAFDA